MKAYKYRLYPTVHPQELMRPVYNWALAAKKEHYQEKGQLSIYLNMGRKKPPTMALLTK